MKYILLFIFISSLGRLSSQGLNYELSLRLLIATLACPVVPLSIGVPLDVVSKPQLISKLAS